jgi:cell division protein FtsN
VRRRHLASRGLTRALPDLPMRRFILAAAFLPFASAGAQVTPSTDTVVRAAGPSMRPATDSLFRRARRLVAEGNGVAGRALVDSLLRAADQTTPAYGDALYWHGALAPTAAEAERDYRRVIVEYPLAYYADDALLAIAELEQARGDRAGALMHLQRYVKEHPGGAGRGIAALGAARLAFEQRDTKVGCSMIAAARSSAAATDVELRNQIEYYGRQCSAESVAATTQAPPRTAPATLSVEAPPPPPRQPSPSTSAAPVTVAPSRVATPATAAPRTTTTTSSTRAPVSTMPAPVTPKPHPAEPAASTTRNTTARTNAASRTPTTPPRAAASTGGRMYTIQVAAYDTRPPAEALVTKLAARGVKARVSGTAKPFRVRLAFYKTRQEASAEVAALKARGIIGFVAEEVPPAAPGARSP